MILAHWRASSRRAGMGVTEATCCRPVATAPQFPSGAHRSRSRALTGARSGSTAPRAAVAAPPGPTSCRCGAELARSAALQGPSTRAGGLPIPPAELPNRPSGAPFRPGTSCPSASSTEPQPCQAPPRRRGGSISKRRAARGRVPSPAPGPARPRRARRLQRHPGRHLAGVARNWRAQRPCKAPPRAQVVSQYPLLNSKSSLRRSVPTPGTRCPSASTDHGPAIRLTAHTGAEHGHPQRRLHQQA